MKRVVFTLAAMGAIGLGFLLFLPVPLGWAINLGARRLMPLDPRARARVEAATLRWRIGQGAALLEITGLAVTVNGRPLVSLDRVTVEIDKASLRRRHYAPQLVSVTGARAVLDNRSGGALHELVSRAELHAQASVAKQAAVMLSALLPTRGAQVRVTVRDFQIEHVLPAFRLTVVGGGDASAVRAAGGDVKVVGSVALGAAGRKPVRARVAGTVAPSPTRIDFSVKVPEFPLSQLPAVPAMPDGMSGAVALAMSGSVDYGTGGILAAQGEFSLRDGRVAITAGTSPVAVERIVLRGNVRRQGGTLTGALDEGVFVVEGATLQVRKLHATIATRTRVEWEAELTGCSGSWLSTRLPAALVKHVPWFARFVEEAAIARLSSAGGATLDRDVRGALELVELHDQQHVDARLAGQPLTLEIAARKTEDSPIAVVVRTTPFSARGIARAFPSSWSLETAAFPVQVEAAARLARSGLLIDANARLVGGAGEVMPWRAGQRTIAVRRAVVEATVSEMGGAIEVPHISVETAMGFFRGSHLRLRTERAETKLTGEIEITDATFNEIVPAFFPAAERALHRVGLASGDFALNRCAVAFSAAGYKDARDGWRLVQADGTAEVHVGVLGKPMSVTASAQLLRGQEEIAAHATVREFRPAEFGQRAVAGVSLGDLEFPLRVEMGTRISVKTAQCGKAMLKLRAGPGEVHVAAVRAGIPFREVAIDAEFDAVKNTLTLPLMRVVLAPGVGCDIKGLTATPSPLKVRGGVQIGPHSLADILAWWPVTLFPEWRRLAAAASPDGYLDASELEFAFQATPGGATIALTHAAGDLTVSRLTIRLPGIPDMLEAETLKMRVSFPGVAVQMRDVRLPGMTIATGEIESADVLAVRPVADARMIYTGYPAAMGTWLRGMSVPPIMMDAMQQSGPVSGELKAILSGSREDFAGTEIELTLRGDKMVLPQLLEGTLDARFRFTAPSPATAMLNATLIPGDARWSNGNRPASFSPVTLRIMAADWRSEDKFQVEVQARAEAFFGMPWRLKATSTLEAGGKAAKHVALDELVLGRTNVSGEWSAGTGTRCLVVAAEQIDLDELVRASAPWREIFRTAPATESAADNRGLLNRSKSAAARKLDARFYAKDIGFGNGRRLHDIKVETSVVDGWPEHLQITALEGRGHRVTADLKPAPGGQRLRVTVEDTAALAQTLTAPLRVAKLPPGRLADAVAVATKIPQHLSGGTMMIDGVISDRPEGVTAKGQFRLENATMAQPPGFVQLLALQRKKSLGKNPLIRRLSVGEWALNPAGIALRGFGLDGSGLIDQLKIRSIDYAFAGEKLDMKVDYFGVGFEIAGTPTAPEVFLEETPLLKALFLQPDSGFFTKEEDPAKTKE